MANEAMTPEPLRATNLPFQMDQRRSWPLRLMLGLLLLLQAAGLWLGAVYAFVRIPDFVLEFLHIVRQQRQGGQIVELFSFFQLYKPLALLVAASALVVIVGRWTGWLLAMLAQSFVLYVSLSLYFRGEALTVTYAIMASAIIMVLLLNSTGVRMIFPVRARLRL